MNRHIIFLLISSSSGIEIGYYLFNKLDSHGITFKIIKWLYQHTQNYFFNSPEFFLIALSVVLAIIIFLGLEILWLCVDEKPQTSRGSAHWAKQKDVKELIEGSGVPIGRFNGKILRTKTHLVTCAPTRSGKGVGAILPTLLEYPGSVVCLDLKGENYAITANFRKKFSQLVCLNPFGLLDIPSNSYNWLDSINITERDCIEKAEKMASLLVGRSADSSAESHFQDQAIRLLQGVILFVCSDDDKEKMNICTVSKLVHDVSLDDLCNAMAAKESEAFGVIASIGRQFLNNSNDKEKGSILSTAQRATNFLDNQNIRETLEKSDFDISQLPKKRTSLYIIIPQDKVSDFSAYIRIFFDLVLSSVIASNGKSKYEVLFLLDEVAQLGYMKNLLDAISFIRGLGGQMWFFFQSLSQLRGTYGKKSGDILENATQIYYGCNDFDTSEHISKTLGKMTLKEYDPDSKKYHYIERDLLAPNEIRGLGPETPIILMAGKAPIKVKRLCHYKDKEYRGKFDPYPNRD